MNDFGVNQDDIDNLRERLITYAKSPYGQRFGYNPEGVGAFIGMQELSRDPHLPEDVRKNGLTCRLCKTRGVPVTEMVTVWYRHKSYDDADKDRKYMRGFICKDRESCRFKEASL